MSDDKPRGLWASALDMADRTPDSRNRYADLLRAIAISCVVLGHWTMAAPYLDDGTAAIAHLLAIEPWTQWLTWCFQVMPVFFFVGGFSNGISWESNLRKGRGFGDWFASRLERLLGPAMVLLLFWIATAAIGHAAGIPAGMITSGSQIALVPTWFLAVYVLVCMTVPLTHKAWERFGMASVVVMIVMAVVMDVIFFEVPSLRWMAWSNFLFIWLAVHQLGYAWQDGLKSGPITLGVGLVGLATLAVLVHFGPYPLSLVGVPGEALADGTTLSNTRPPKLPILAHGLAQIGLLLALQGVGNRWLKNRKPWAATVLANGMIMTVFLWHSTSMILLFGLGFLLGGIGLEAMPRSGGWWSVRPLWIIAFAIGTVPFIAAFRRFERTSGRPAVAVPRLVVGCVLTCVGLAMLAISGVNDPEQALGLSWIPLSLPLVGCAIAGFGPLSIFEVKLRGRPSAADELTPQQAKT